MEQKQARPVRRTRRDAVENRRRLLQSAREVFAVAGIDVTLEEIVRHAGYGIGTFYRHFRNREELLDELFEESVAEFEEMFQKAEANAGDPWKSFEHLMHSLFETMTNDRALWTLAIRGSSRDARLARLEELNLRYLKPIVLRAQAAGKLRADIGIGDMAVIQQMMLRSLDFTYVESPGAAQRYLEILIDGLRVRRSKPTALSAPEPTHEQMVASIQRSFDG